MNHPKVMIRRRLIYVAMATVVVAVLQLGLQGVVWEGAGLPVFADDSRQGVSPFTLAALFVLLVLTLVLVRRARHLENSEAKIWLASGLDRLVFEHSPVGMLLSGTSGRVRAVNAAYCRLTGYSEHELLGRIDSFQRAGSLDVSREEEMTTSLQTQGLWRGNVWVRKPRGEALEFSVSRIALLDGEHSVQAYLTICQETSTDSEAERLMLWQAHHDILTKLPNANLFQERLGRFLIEQRNDAQSGTDADTSLVREGAGDNQHCIDGGVLSINLDGFSQINDSMGFAAGDQVLMEAGLRVVLAARETDTVARLGGDHFGVLLSGLRSDSEIGRIASSVVEAMARPFLVRSRELFVTASVGVNALQRVPKTSAPSPGEVMQRADSARAQASQSGGNCVVFYEAAMNESAQARYELEVGLRGALHERQLELYYQPLIDQYQGELVSFEALLRWHHPDRGVVSPAEFIPLAEETGLIVDIGIWLVHKAHERLRSWAADGFGFLRLSINISTRQLRDPADVEMLVDALCAPETNRLTIEITESLLVANKDLYRSFLLQAQGLGAKVALDDFGTGYSSLSYLRDYRFDVLKIDRAFIAALGSESDTNQADRNLVASIISLGKILNLEVVAEGVEEEIERQLLAELGCALIQGYYYGAPMPAGEAQTYLRNFRETGALRMVDQAANEA